MPESSGCAHPVWDGQFVCVSVDSVVPHDHQIQGTCTRGLVLVIALTLHEISHKKIGLEGLRHDHNARFEVLHQNALGGVQIFEAIAALKIDSALYRMSCSNHVKQLGLAMHNYHSAYNAMPKHGTGFGGVPGTHSIQTDASATSSLMHLSAFVALTSFIEQQVLWEEISNPSTFRVSNPTAVRTPPWSSMGPIPVRTTIGFDYRLWVTQLSALRCPSDPGNGLPALGRSNYSVCLGSLRDRRHQHADSSTA